MSQTINVFLCRVIDSFMALRDALIGRIFVCINRCIQFGIVGNKLVDRWLVDTLNNLHAYLVGLSVFGTNNSSHVYSTAPSQFGSFGKRFVGSFATNLRFIKLHRAIKWIIVFNVPRFTNALHNKPGCFLGNTNVPMQLHAADRLETGCAKVNGNRPLLKRDVCSCHRSICSDTEIRPARFTPIWHRLCIGDFFCICITTLRAIPATIPDNGFKPLCSSIFRWKHLHHLNKCKSFTAGFAGGFLCHLKSPVTPICISIQDTFVKWGI